MRDLEKPKYNRLLQALHAKDLYLEHDTINDDNCEEIIGSFKILNTEPIIFKKDKDAEPNEIIKKAKCFCTKRIWNVYNLESNGKVFLECGSTCLETVFGDKDELIAKQTKIIEKEFLSGNLTNHLGFEAIEDYGVYIKEVIDRLVKNAEDWKLYELKIDYINNNYLVNKINEEIERRRLIHLQEEEEEKERIENERLNQIRWEEEEKERIENERLNKIKWDKEEKERLENEEKERLEKLKLKTEENERIRIENEKYEKDRKERERLENIRLLEEKKEQKRLQIEYEKQLKEETARKLLESKKCILIRLKNLHECYQMSSFNILIKKYPPLKSIEDVLRYLDNPELISTLKILQQHIK